MTSQQQSGESNSSVPDQLRKAVHAWLPAADVQAVDNLATLLNDLLTGHISPDIAQAKFNTSADLQALLLNLMGRELRHESTLISFGAGSQFGDISISDVAGRDIIKISVGIQQYVFTQDQRYDVRGLSNPYVGLRPFTYYEQHAFSGRETLVAKALALLTTPGEERNHLLVTGASGSGKSSLVQAGLLPALEAHYRARQRPVRYALLRPGRQPLAALADALSSLGLNTDAPFDVVRPFLSHRPSNSAMPGQVSVLILDQVEELFTQVDAAQRQTVFTLIEQIPPFRERSLHFLATLRSDFLAELFEQRALYEMAKQGIDVRAMGRDELRAAIEQPVQRAHPAKGIELSLRDQLADDASTEAGYLPLLQVTLEELWNRGSMTRAAYSHLGDAIRQRAEDVYLYTDPESRLQRRSSDEQHLVLSLLIDLVAVDLNDTHRDVRRRRGRGELTKGDPVRRQIVDQLVAARLLISDIERNQEAEIEVIDIVHERLLVAWERLNTAIGEQREMLRQRGRFELALREWVRAGQPAGLLLEGIRLAEAQMLVERSDVALQSDIAQSFLVRSRERQDGARQRQLRITQMVASVLALLLLTALGMALWLFSSRRRARLRGMKPSYS
jgi:energy-coupling factor transporter ATP-binding protein EcfA2